MDKNQLLDNAHLASSYSNTLSKHLPYGSKSQKTLGAISTVASALIMANEMYEAWKKKNGWEIHIDSYTWVAVPVLKWLMTQPGSNFRKTEIKPNSEHSGNDIQAVPMITEPFTINFNGYPIHVSTERQEIKGGSQADRRFRKGREGERIILSGYSPNAYDALVKQIEKISQQSSTPLVYTNLTFGGWEATKELPARKLESVVLQNGLSEKIFQDAQQFLLQEENYLNLGLPWHRGYLFHGVPGAGKTSYATALAHALNKDLYYLSLSSLDNDSSLIDSISEMTTSGILLLEDIDIVTATKERNSIDKSITLGGLLNALDGTLTPHGLIVIMTTNNIDDLDPALIRPGRVDIMEEFGNLTGEQVKRIFTHFYKEQTPTLKIKDTKQYKTPPAHLLEIIKNNLNEPEAAYRQFKNETGT